MLVLTLLLCGGALAESPVVFRVSEGVRPGAIVSLYGEYLTGQPAVRFLRPDGTIAATQAAVQTDRGGHFCRVVFPAIPAGAYRLSVSSATARSTCPIFVNRADPRWLSDERAYSGLPLKLIGRNLDAREYGSSARTRVRLVPVQGGEAVLVAPEAVNPYCVDFTVPEGLKTGAYHVEVSTGSVGYGGEWVRLDDHSEFPETIRPTVLQVEPAPDDPTARALSVGWSNDFTWNRAVDASREFQARGDGASDDTGAIQAALDHVGKLGGGVVVLPQGTYLVSRLVMGPGCILRGAGREATVVRVSKTVDDGAILMQGERHGACGLTLSYQPNVPPLAQGMILAGTAEKLFLHDVSFDLLRSPDVRVEQSAYYFTGRGPMLVANCRFFLPHRNLWDHAVRNRLTFRDNAIDMHDGLGFCLSSEKLLLLRNELVFHPAAYAGQMNGFFLNEGWVGWNITNSYIAGNQAHDLNGPGDCQPFAADSAWSCLAGAVTGSSRNSVDVRADVRGDLKGLDTHELELVVVQGRGLGQLRRMTAHRSLGGDPPVVRFNVCPPWDVPPDGTSMVSAGSWHVNNVFWRNTARRSKSAYNMYYGGCYDCVDADAISENTEGWYNWGRIGEMAQGSWHCPVYFSQLRRSSFSGIAPQTQSMGITLRVENETKQYRGIADYGTEIRDNTIDRSACRDRRQRLAGSAAIACFNQSWMTVTPATPLLFATLCEGNRIKHSATGFDLDGSFSFAIRGTIYEDCPNPVNDRGHDTALLDDRSGR
jgi:hypothetical protein